MSSKVIVIIIAVLVLLGVGGLVFYDYNSKKNAQVPEPVVNNNNQQVSPNLPPTPPVNNLPTADEGVKVPEATGNIDDAVSSFLQELNSENEFLTAEDQDAALIKSDSDALGAIGQSTDGISF